MAAVPVNLSVPDDIWCLDTYSPRCGCKRLVMTERIEGPATQIVQEESPARESGAFDLTMTTVRDA